MTTTVVSGYDPAVKFYATRYRQGGRTVYSLDLSLSQVAALLPAPDPSVVSPGNRRIDPAHARGFSRYIRSQDDWIAPGLTLRGPAIFKYEVIESIEGTEFGIVSLPRLSALELHIIDGQHRILGIHTAIREMSDEMDKVRTSLAQAKRTEDPVMVHELEERLGGLTAQRERFDKERVSIQMYVEEDQERAKQMFYDTTHNAKGTTASINTGFDARAVVNRAVRRVTGHPLLVGRVDRERDRLGRSNPNLLSAKHVADIVRIVNLGLDGRMTRRAESELNEQDMAERANDFFDLLTEAFPKLRDTRDGKLSPDLLRGGSMLGSPVTIRALAGLYFELVKEGKDHEEMRVMLKGLNGSLTGRATARLAKHAPDGVVEEGALAPGSRRQEVAAFKDALVDWVFPSMAA